ncbi:MAG TPA: hypothetical protein PLT45_04025 [Smithella sp.]|nr:hypothetical protein [Smithella sp.]
MKLLRYILCFVLISLWWPVLSGAVETGSALKDDVLRKEPYSDSRTTGSMARGEKLQILAKKGAWLNVKTARATGWVRLLSVKKGIAASGNQIKGVLDVASGRAGTGKVVATTGVRGLGEEDLKNAQYSESEVKTMESYTQTIQEGQQFAKKGGLKAIKISYLPPARRGGEK